MKNYILLLSVILLLSCKNGNNNIKFNNLLTEGGKDETWRFEALEDDNYVLIYYHRFYNKNYKTYDKYKILTENIPLDEKEGFEELTWYFREKDSLLSLGPRLEYKVVSYSKDTILLSGYKYKGSFRMIRTPIANSSDM